MSWLSGITGKAEDFLNKLDNSAAQALNVTKSDDTYSGTLSTAISDHSSYTTSYSSHPGLSQNIPSRGTVGDSTSSFVSTPIKQKSLRPQVKSTSQVSESTQPSKPTQTVDVAATKTTSKNKLDTACTDEALFEFLNSSEPVDNSKKKTNPPPSTPNNSGRHSRQSSTSSSVSVKGANVKTLDTVASSSTADNSPPSTNSGSSIVHVEIPGSGSERGSPNDSEGGADIDALTEALLEQSSSNSVHSNQEIDTHHGETQQKLSSLELENKLLKNEVASLNQEMASVVQRAKGSQLELHTVQRKLNEYNRNSSKNDQVVRELQSRENDLMEALTAKDSQLAILRIRLEEADKSVEQKQKNILDLEDARNRILKDHSDSSGMHGQALDTLKEKLEEVENALRREQAAYKSAQQEARDRQSKLEQEQKALAEALTSAERRMSDEKAKVTDLTNQIKTAKSNLDSAKQELTDYKEKATRILQSKERLIASLREGSGASGDMSGVSSLEYDSVKQERDMLREELQQSKMTVENLRVDLQDLETQLQLESESAQDQIKSLEENGADEKRRREEAEQELLKQKQELQYAIEEMHKQKAAFQSCLSDREAEIDKLRNQLTHKNISSTTESELESRVRSLTESLIQKQTMLESLSTEKNSLTLQLERLGQQYKDIQASSLRTNTSVVNVTEDEDVRQRVPAFMRETPTDTEVTKKIKKAANSIDKFSIRLGVFLRRYPMARVFIILYMAFQYNAFLDDFQFQGRKGSAAGCINAALPLSIMKTKAGAGDTSFFLSILNIKPPELQKKVVLHLWVMIVLLTYQPEMHGADFQPQEPRGEDPGGHGK